MCMVNSSVWGFIHRVPMHIILIHIIIPEEKKTALFEHFEFKDSFKRLGEYLTLLHIITN